jgi:hypothetical protein
MRYGHEIAQGAFPPAALPSAAIVGTRTREWVTREAEYRRQLTLARAADEATPGLVQRTRRWTGQALIRAGAWCCRLGVPAAKRSAPTV